MEQSIKSVLVKQTIAHQQQQLTNLQVSQYDDLNMKNDLNVLNVAFLFENIYRIDAFDFVKPVE